jgi:hypothetical protein
MTVFTTLTFLLVASQLGQSMVIPGLNTPNLTTRDLERRIAGSIPIQTTTSNLWIYDHCQWDPTLATLNAYTFYSNSMTPEVCTAACAARGYTYAGVRDRNYCGCGNRFNSGYAIDRSNCQYWSCAGAPSIACGGDYALGVYVLWVICSYITLRKRLIHV